LAGIRRVVEIVGAAFGVPVAIDNDANMTPLGERRHGAGRGLPDFLLITLGANMAPFAATRHDNNAPAAPRMRSSQFSSSDAHLAERPAYVRSPFATPNPRASET